MKGLFAKIKPKCGLAAFKLHILQTSAYPHVQRLLKMKITPYSPARLHLGRF